MGEITTSNKQVSDTGRTGMGKLRPGDQTWHMSATNRNLNK